MAYRHVMVSSAAKLSIRQKQLVLTLDGVEAQRIPVEDLASLLLENHQITLTNAALSALANAGVVVFTCNEKHMPNAILTPYHHHSRKAAVLAQQVAFGNSDKNRLWKQIVQEKVRNQGQCLVRTIGKDAGLEAMACRVKKGDHENMEATAAMVYFPALFGAGYYRREETIANVALNYGYSLLRGTMARHIVNYGLEPALGLHHCNQLNGFNLVDDLMEPYRPVVDILVAENLAIWERADRLTSEMKKCLYELLYQEVKLEDLSANIYYAMECTVQSLLQCLDGERKKLRFPTIFPEKDDETVCS